MPEIKCKLCGKLISVGDSKEKYIQCPYCGENQEKVKVEKPTTFLLGKKRIFPTEIREILVLLI